ncbi:hypothetical protein COO60DRAFT_1580681 [Scenedesmus sp. NREL 46B-D3]|nr:hypothetical protein COO60DRAFT_1580681 [Scenedesmus sp. NREL 46B-D3]
MQTASRLAAQLLHASFVPYIAPAAYCCAAVCPRNARMYHHLSYECPQSTQSDRQNVQALPQRHLAKWAYLHPIPAAHIARSQQTLHAGRPRSATLGPTMQDGDCQRARSSRPSCRMLPCTGREARSPPTSSSRGSEHHTSMHATADTASPAHVQPQHLLHPAALQQQQQQQQLCDATGSFV